MKHLLALAALLLSFNANAAYFTAHGQTAFFSVYTSAYATYANESHDPRHGPRYNEPHGTSGEMSCWLMGCKTSVTLTDKIVNPEIGIFPPDLVIYYSLPNDSPRIEAKASVFNLNPEYGDNGTISIDFSIVLPPVEFFPFPNAKYNGYIEISDLIKNSYGESRSMNPILINGTTLELELTAVPLPSSMLLFLPALIGLIGLKIRKS
jgi:hypothetical protein